MDAPGQKKLPSSLHKMSGLAGLAVVSVIGVIALAYLFFSNSPPSGTASQMKPKEVETMKDSDAIKEFVNRYFSTWSNQDMKGYDACFLPEASIHYIDSEDNVTMQTRKKFIAEQTEYHQRAAVRATEAAESVDIRMGGKLANVVVFWRLKAGARNETGYDHFTLAKVEGAWRIVDLTFYASARNAE